MSTLAGNAIGVPYPSANAGAVDHWSLDIFAALRDWAPSRNGSWSRWEPGYLLLDIRSAAEGLIEPAALWTADEEITVAFGNWEDVFVKGTPAGEAASEAIQLIEGWMRGVAKTLVFTNDSDDWCGTIPVFDDGLWRMQLSQGVGKLFPNTPTRPKLQSANRGLWRTFRVIGGRLLD